VKLIGYPPAADIVRNNNARGIGNAYAQARRKRCDAFAAVHGNSRHSLTSRLTLPGLVGASACESKCEKVSRFDDINTELERRSIRLLTAVLPVRATILPEHHFFPIMHFVLYSVE